MNTVIKATNLKKNYVVKGQNIEALKGCTFEVSAGSSTGFVGVNGAGKSTTIKLLTGIMKPESGTVEILGKDPMQSRKEIMRQIGVLFGQRSNLIYDLPVKESFSLLKEIYNIEKKQFEKQFELICQYIEVKELLETPVRLLSLGQRMRCEVAAVLLHSPRVVFFDEAFLGIDFKSKKMIQKLVRILQKDFNTTFFMTSHDIKDIERMCDDVIIINEGMLVKHDKISSLIQNSKYVHVMIQFSEEIQEDFISQYVNVDKINIEDNSVECWIEREKCSDVLNILSSVNMIMSYSVNDSTLEEIIEHL